MNLSKIRSATALALVIGVMCFSGCGSTYDPQQVRNSTHGPGVGPKYGDQFVVAWVPMDSPKNEYWKVYDQGVRDAVEKAGGKLLYLSGQGDAVVQHDCVAQAIAQNVDMLLIYPVDSNAIGAAIQEANAAGIPVGILWNPVPKTSGANVDFTVAINDEEAAGRSTKSIVDKLIAKYGEPRGKVLEVQGRMVTAGGKRRGAGFHNVIDQYPNIKVTSKSADWDTGKGTTVIQDWMSAYPDTDAIFFHSDGAYTPAAVAALSPLHRWLPSDSEQHVICAGIDGSNIAVHAIMFGFMEHTTGTEHAAAGELLGSLAMDLLKSGKRPDIGSQMPCPNTAGKRADVFEDAMYSGPLVFIPTTSITAENAGDPSLFANKYQGEPNGLSEKCIWE